MSIRTTCKIIPIIRKLQIRRIIHLRSCYISLSTFNKSCGIIRTTTNIASRNYQVQKMSLSDAATGVLSNEIQFADLKEQLSNCNVLLVDVREPKELATDGKIPGSINIPLADVERAFGMVPDKFQDQYGVPLPSKDDSRVVFSCRSGRRATMALERVQKLGFTHARCYVGSFMDWVEKGGQIEKS